MLWSVAYAFLRLILDVGLLGFRNREPDRAEILALRHQVRVLERQVKRVRWQPADRLIVAALREQLPSSAWERLLVRPETVLGWHRALVRRRWAMFGRCQKLGRPVLARECRELIVRLAEENSTWGYMRLRGELRKLGYSVSATSIRSVLRRGRIRPAPGRRALSWRRFLSAHASAIVACDFFSVDTVFLKRLYVLFFLHLGSRRIVLATCTDRPDAAWVSQQARNLAWRLGEEGLKVGFLIRDHDRKYPDSFDEIFRSESARVIKTPIRAPLANSMAERWVGSARRECLDWMLIVGQAHLRRVIREYVEHYNTARPHRSLDLSPPAGSLVSARGAEGAVVMRMRLGGLLREYARELMAA